MAKIEDTKKAQAWVDACKHLNDGMGMIIHQALANDLRKIGVYGPYTVLRPDQ